MDEKQPLKKNNSNQLDFIIVGQGIAGSVLALSLIKSGYSVCVIDKQDLSLSSRIAAGIWNPVVFKRLTKSWLADDLVSELIRFYEFFEKEMNVSFINRRYILKPFSEEQEKTFWLKKAELDNKFLDKSIYEDFQLTDSYNIKSYSKVMQAGNIDLPMFLETTKKYISQYHQLIEESFDHHNLKRTEDGVTYQSVIAKNIIFCEGHLISKNPYFNWIPFKPAKGEVLTITCIGLHLENAIFNKGFFIMPLGNNTYKVGATYEWENLNDTPTESKKQELIAKLNSVISIPYQIVKHEAGVRPSVIDRRPVVGCHPEFSNVYIFNGFGSKSVMLAPYFAKQLVNFIQNTSSIDSEVNPSRFTI